MKKNYGSIHPKVTSFLHGADYNPEQWRDYEGVWDEDMRLMNLAHVNVVSIGIFSWSALEPEEGVFDFSWLDEIIDRLENNGSHFILATPSGARPAWLSQKYPEVLRTNADRSKNLHGERHNHCFSSPIYREKTHKINTLLAKRYGERKGLILWHISNELSGECHCEYCQEAFRNYLKDVYHNDLTALNQAWWTSFWSHTYTDWSQIESPSPLGEHSVHGHTLDWKRFVTHQTIDFMKNEINPLREITPEIPITTNFMNLFEGLDYWKVAKEIDVASWDSYPMWHESQDDFLTASWVGFNHDMNRSFKHGKPFLLMESTPSMTNWQSCSKLKRPGMHLLSSLQAVAHGSDSVQYFQWRKSRGASEKFHGAVVDHCGHEHTRVFQDVSNLGKTLENLGPIIGTSVAAKVAIVYDWDNLWAFEDARGLNNRHKDYIKTIHSHYLPFFKKGIGVDVIDSTQDFSPYQLVIAPLLYMIKPGVAQRLEHFVREGGTFVSSYCSGVVDEHDLAFLGGFPGPLRELMGIWVEETDSLYPDDENHVSYKNKTYSVKELCDLIHLESAISLARYEDDFYSGRPALSVNSFGKGSAYYIAFRNTDHFQEDFYNDLISQLALEVDSNLTLPIGVSLQIREDEKNRFFFFMNFTKEEKTIHLPKEHHYFDILDGRQHTEALTLNGYGVNVIKVVQRYDSTL